MPSDMEVVLASYASVNRGNVAGAMEALAPDAEWHESGVLPEPEVHRGRAGIAAFLSDFLTQWETFHQEVTESRALADGRVAVFIHLTAVGRESSAEVDASYAHIWRMRDGLGVRVDAFYERAEALAAIESP